MAFLRKLFRGDDEAPARHKEEPDPSSALVRERVDEQAEDETAAPAAAADLPAPDQAGEPAQAWWEDAAPLTDAAVAAADQPDQPVAAGATAPILPEEPAVDEPTPVGVDAGADAVTAVEAGVDRGRTQPLLEPVGPGKSALRSRQGLAAAALRDVGRVRAINQDSVFAMITTLPRDGHDVAMGLFIVADGMGGHDGGEIASRIAISAVAKQVLDELVVPALIEDATEALQPLIVSAVQEANRVIWEYASAIGSDMGTTCTAVLMLGNAFYVGHVGDSRAYVRTPEGLRCITTDHSAVGRLIELGQLDPSEARDHPLRSQLYRTVGQHPEIGVDFIYQPIGDATHLLLGSDGLWSMLDDSVLLDVLEHTTWPHDACRELIARANLAGGEDNISVVVVALPESQ